MEVGKEISLEEIKDILHDFDNDKSLGPDGWTIEFFTHFFDLVGSELREAVEDIRIKIKLPKDLNATFISLILKKDRPKYFNDYRPISLCNLVYKVVTNFLSNKVKTVFERVISDEKIGFLSNRQILDVVGVVHETLHSIKVKNIQAFILKMDIIKAYDRVDWSYLRLILI